MSLAKTRFVKLSFCILLVIFRLRRSVIALRAVILFGYAFQ